MVEMKSSKAESLPSANAKKSISISFNAKRKSAPAKAPNKRPHSALAGEDSDSEEDDIKPQTVVAIDKSGAFSSDRVNAHNAKSPPLTIPTEKNINWEVEARKKYFRDGVIPKQDADARTFDIAKGDPQWEDEDNVKFGLQLRNRRDKDFDFVEDAQKAAEKQPIPSHEEDEHWTERHISHRISDQNVMDAILHERKMDQMIQIHSVDGANYKTHAHYLPFENEQDKFKADVARRPESASLEDYDAIPVEQFGAALLRGMVSPLSILFDFHKPANPQLGLERRRRSWEEHKDEQTLRANSGQQRNQATTSLARFRRKGKTHRPRR